MKIVLSTEESENYFANVVTVTVTIDPKVLVIEWDGPFEFNYDGYVHGPDAHAFPVIASDSVSPKSTTFSTKLRRSSKGISILWISRAIPKTAELTTPF